MTARDLERLVEAAGWRFHRSKGSHHHYRHPDRVGIVTIPFHAGEFLRERSPTSSGRRE